MKIPVLATAATLALALGSAAMPAAAFENGDVQLQGTVTFFDGRYDLHVQDANGDVHDVQLHPGTIINPEGLALENGMTVTVLGSPAGDALDANEIDTPYLNDGSVDPTYSDGYDSGVVFGGGGYVPYGYGSGYVYGGYPVYGRHPGSGYANARPSTVSPNHAFAPEGRRAPQGMTARPAAPAPATHFSSPSFSHAAPSGGFHR